MPLNVQVSPQYQGIVEPAGSPQHTTVNDLNENFASVSAIPSGFVGTARVGTDLYVGDGLNIAKHTADLLTQNPATLLLFGLRNTIISNGGTVNDKDLQALKSPLNALMKTSTFKKLVELWIPVGDGYLSAMCKLLGYSTKIMTGNNLVDADYSRYLGIKGNGTTKDISTGFTPTALTNSWGFAVQPTGTVSVSGVTMLCGSGNNTWLGFGSALTAKINNALEIPLESKQGRLIAVQNDSVNGCSAFYGGYKNSASAAGVTNSNQLRLLSYGGSLYSDTSVGGFAAWSGNLTSQELLYLQDFFNNASLALNMLVKNPSITFCGDSLTRGFGLASPTTERFSALTSAYLGAIEDNQGADGSAMSSYIPGGFTVSWYTSKKVNVTNRNSTYLVVCLGYNDSRGGGDVNLFISNYTEWLGYQLTMGGIDVRNILLISPPASMEPNANQQSLITFKNAVQNIANLFGTKYLNLYDITVGHPEYYQSDLIHFNATGNIAVYNAIVNVLLAS